MLFTEPTFLFLFLPILIAFYVSVSSIRARNLLLVIASVIFYAKGGGSFTFLILLSIVFNYWMAIAVSAARVSNERRARQLLALAVGVDLAVLGVFAANSW